MAELVQLGARGAGGGGQGATTRLQAISQHVGGLAMAGDAVLDLLVRGGFLREVGTGALRVGVGAGVLGGKARLDGLETRREQLATFADGGTGHVDLATASRDLGRASVGPDSGGLDSVARRLQRVREARAVGAGPAGPAAGLIQGRLSDAADRAGPGEPCAATSEAIPGAGDDGHVGLGERELERVGPRPVEEHRSREEPGEGGFDTCPPRPHVVGDGMGAGRNGFAPPRRVLVGHKQQRVQLTLFESADHRAGCGTLLHDHGGHGVAQRGGNCSLGARLNLEMIDEWADHTIDA